MNHWCLIKRLGVVLSLASLAGSPPARAETGFTSLFDGNSLNGWTVVGKPGAGYAVKDGTLICPPECQANCLTEKEFSDFAFRFEFKLTPGANNGIAIRAPLEGNATALGMEIQILDDPDPQYAGLEPYQYHGSVYGIAPARRGALKKTGEWNSEEILAQGRHIRVTLNDTVIVDTDLNNVRNPAVLRAHPGLLSAKGHIGFFGHTARTEFHNLRIKELSLQPQRDNDPPSGFVALYNGKDLTGWKGLLARPNDNPIKRAALSAQDRAKLQAEADQRMRDHWRSESGALVFDGKGDSLCTWREDYGDFEMWVDWKIPAKGDSGIYLRGSPQVQIWDTNTDGQFTPPVGSGGLYNNEKNPSNPLVFADEPVDHWNRFRILMVGDKVHVYLNDRLVVNDTTFENYWDRTQPIFPLGQIELQNHGNTLYFKNIYIREIRRSPSL